MLNTNKIPQSILVNGKNLDDIEKFAIEWAAKLLNVDFAAATKHPDFFAIRPVNKMRQINVESIRAVISDVVRSPMIAKMKVVVIYEAERMNLSASNAFLKTLEEPPEDTSIFLLSTKPYDLLPTIRSRCWWVNLKSQKSADELDIEWIDWLKSFESYAIKAVLKNADAMEMYAILHNFHILFEKTTSSKGKQESDKLTEAELEAANASTEKYICQKKFEDIESAIVNLAHKTTDIKIISSIPRLIDLAEKAYARTELNLQPVAALESFLVAIS